MSEQTSPARDREWLMRTYSGALDGEGLQRAVPDEPVQGADRSVIAFDPPGPRRATTRTTCSHAGRSARSVSPSPTSGHMRTLLERHPSRGDETRR